jgi:protein TonB
VNPPTEAAGADNRAAASGAEDDASSRQGRGPLLRYGAVLALVAVLFGGVVYSFTGHDDLPPPRQVRELTIVNIVPPPPRPPPPPPPPEQKMIEQPKMAEPEFKEDKPLDKPKDEPVRDAKNEEPPGPLSLDAKPVGPGDLFNLGGKPGGNPYGGGGGGGSRWGWYSVIVTSQIEAAMRANPKTRNIATQIQVRLWADGTGRVTRVVLTPSTGDAEVDAAIRNDVIGGLTLREPPPKDMPMPVVTRVTAHRPS